MIGLDHRLLAGDGEAHTHVFQRGCVLARRITQ